MTLVLALLMPTALHVRAVVSASCSPSTDKVAAFASSLVRKASPPCLLGARDAKKGKARGRDREGEKEMAAADIMVEDDACIERKRM